MKTKIIIITTYIMVCFTGSKGNAQASPPKVFLNEFWTYTQNLDHIAHIAEVYYFTSEGKFYFESVWSSGTYFVNCYSGTYEYNPTINEIILHIQEKYARGLQIGTEDFTESSQKLSIVSLSNSVATIEDIIKNQRFPDKKFYRQPCINTEMFVLPGIEQMFAVGQVKVRKEDSYSDLVSMKDDDWKELLDIVRSAHYDQTMTDEKIHANKLKGKYIICISGKENPEYNKELL